MIELDDTIQGLDTAVTINGKVMILVVNDMSQEQNQTHLKTKSYELTPKQARQFKTQLEKVIKWAEEGIPE